jgi:Domain of unknown function (DUF4157)
MSIGTTLLAWSHLSTTPTRLWGRPVAHWASGDQEEAEAKAAQDAVARYASTELTDIFPGASDLGGVILHEDPVADRRTRDAGAQAMTIGSDVYFASGHDQLETRAGRSLIAHEMAHVLQQREDGIRRIQSAPPKGRAKAKPAGTGGATGPDLHLPWTWGDYSAAETTVSGIRFLLALPTSRMDAVLALIPKFAAQIAGDNAAIGDPGRRVMTCFVTPATTRFAYWRDAPALMIDPDDAATETITHEMGHAVLDAFMHVTAPDPQHSDKPPARAPATALIPSIVADLYLRLRATKPPADGRSVFAVGLMMVDPSWWSPGAKSEHPWTDADEFFASAKAAYQTDLKGLVASIARATKEDPTAGPLGKELLALLGGLFGKGRLPSGTLADERLTAAKAELGRAKSATHVEDSASGGAYPLLAYLLDPDSRPGRK